MLKISLTDLTGSVEETILEWLENQDICTVEYTRTQMGLVIEPSFFNMVGTIDCNAERAIAREQVTAFAKLTAKLAALHASLACDFLLADEPSLLKK